MKKTRKKLLEKSNPGLKEKAIQTISAERSAELEKLVMPQLLAELEWRKKIDPHFQKKINPLLKRPRPHQLEAIRNGINYFSDHTRGKMIMPCGSGKTLTALWLAKAMDVQHLIIAFPNLSLEAQTVDAWLKDMTDTGSDYYHVLVLGSDKKIAKLHNVDVTTNVDDIEIFLCNNCLKRTVIFTTYHSSQLIKVVAEKLNFVFDFSIFDEAHHTAGLEKTLFQSLLSDNGFSIRKRLFMTATPKVLLGLGDNQFVKSMDDEELYGKEFYSLSIREAIDQKIISDYKVITLYSSNEEIKKWIQKNVLLKDTSEILPIEAQLRYVSTAISVCKAIKEYSLKRLISYHDSIKFAKIFQELMGLIAPVFGINVNVFHLNGGDNAQSRDYTVKMFEDSEIGIITNARLLNEGFDIPAVDAVVFVDERHSATDIVQASGRAWRLSENKKYGYILLPVLVGEYDDFDSKELKTLRRTLATLSGQDEVLAGYFRQSQKTIAKSERAPIIQENMSISFDFNHLVEDINLKVWSNIRSLYYKSYEDAKKWVVENLVPFGVDNGSKWRQYINKSNYLDAPELPGDIPKRPEYPYRGEWAGYREFLSSKKLNYQEACIWNHSNLPVFNTIKEYRNYILKHPTPNIADYQTYKYQMKKSFLWTDFIPLNNNNYDYIAKKREKIIDDYEAAKKWAIENLKPLGIDTEQKFRVYKKNHPLPGWMYSAPEKYSGFISYKDFFGINVDDLNSEIFEKSKKWVQENLVPHGIASTTALQAYKKGLFPDAPPVPEDVILFVAKNPAFKGWPDFFGEEAYEANKKKNRARKRK